MPEHAAHCGRSNGCVENAAPPYCTINICKEKLF